MKIGFHQRRRLLLHATFITLGSTDPVIREAMPWLDSPIGWDNLGYFAGAWVCGAMIFLIIGFSANILIGTLLKIFWDVDSKEKVYGNFGEESLYYFCCILLAICALYWIIYHFFML